MAEESGAGRRSGARYRPTLCRQTGFDLVSALCGQLSGPGRVLPGGLLYLADIIADPKVIGQMGMILASEYSKAAPDFILTMETQGIPLAMMTAQVLRVPVLIARRNAKAYEGPTVHISYLVGSQYKTMSLSRRLVQPGQRALLIDDVLRSGGTARGMFDMMSEFSAEVVGAAMLVGTEDACETFHNIKTLMILEGTDESTATARLRPGDCDKAWADLAQRSDFYNGYTIKYI
jgi:purine operon repressor